MGICQGLELLGVCQEEIRGGAREPQKPRRRDHDVRPAKQVARGRPLSDSRDGEPRQLGIRRLRQGPPEDLRRHHAEDLTRR